MLSILLPMECKIYFETKYILLTDGKGTKKNETYSICCNKSDILQAIKELKRTNSEFIVLYNENFNELLSLFKSNFRYIEAAGGFIKNEEGEYLFIFRREKCDLPKGKLEIGETPEVAALREVSEETGLQKVVEKNYRCSTWHTYELHDEQILKQTYWFNMEAKKQKKSTPQLEEEITELQWIAPNNFPKVLSNTFPSIVEVINAK